VLLRAGKLPAADDEITAAIEASSRFGAAEIAASHEVAARIALARHNADAALRHADAVQNAAPAMPMRAFVQGQVLAANGETEEASRVLRGAAAMLRQHDATLEGLQLALGRTLMALDQREDAETAFRAELTSFPRNTAAYTDVVQLLHDTDRDDEAGKVVTSLLTATPTPEGYATAAEVRSDARSRFPLESAPARLARVKPR
jgi:tetratricopeptide (TPR) repeat protein